ncbi:MAG: manganese/iron ABC transporter ATP-binding protein, partial [Mesorhizobium sp.]
MNEAVPPLAPAFEDAGGGLAVRGATVTYRNGHTALR